MSRNILLIVLMFLFYFFTASGNIDSIDATTHLYLARQIVNKGRIDFGTDATAQKMVSKINEINNNYYPVYNFGYALCLIPAVMLSNTIHTALRVQQSSYPANPDWIMTWYINLFNGVVLIGIFFTVKRLVSHLSKKIPKHLDLYLLLAIFSSNLIVQAHQQFVHLLFSLLTCLALEQLLLLLKTKQNQHLYLFSLFFTSIAASYNTTFLFLIPAFLLLYFLRTEKNKMYNTFRFLLMFTPAFLVQAVWNYTRFNNPLLTGYHNRSEGIYVFNFIEMIKHIYGMTIGPNKGLLVYSPFLILSIYFCIQGYKKGSKELKAFIVFLSTLSVTYILVYSPVIFWHGDSAYGPRYLTPLVVFGLFPFVLFMNQINNKLLKRLAILIIGVGFLIQVPGLLIPHFTYRFITKPGCVNSERWYYDHRCTPFLIGWAQLMKRETKTTALIFQKGPLVTNKYPNPLTPFKTIYPDPLFDAFSKYKVGDYKISEDLLNNIYAFSPDLWWVKLQYYKNILP